MFRKFVAALIIIFAALDLSLAQTPTASQIQRTQELLEKERALQEKIKTGTKVFVKFIVVQGASLINKEEISQITSGFKNRWLSQSEIKEILGLVRELYRQGGYQGRVSEVFYKMEKNSLIITVKEVKESK